MNRATYNIHDDRLKVWFSERLGAEEYEAAKRAGFVYFYGQKCFSCVWRPGAEDFIAKHGIEIECTAEADDVAARVDRFDKYAGNAENRASSAADRLETGAANTERRQRLAEGVAAREFSKAEHWQRRIAAAIRHADFKEDPAAIYRRIETLEKDLRRHVAAQEVEDCEPSSANVWMGGKGRGQGYWRARSDVPAIIAYHSRWCDHLRHRMEYEQARLAATGDILAKLAANEVVIEVGSAVEAAGFPLSVQAWYLVTKITPASIEVYVPAGMKRFQEGCTWVKITRDQVLNVATPAQVEAGEITVQKPEHKKPTRRGQKIETTHSGQKPEKFASFTRSDGTRYIITKVNRISVDYLTRYETTGGAGGERFYIGKCSINSIIDLKSAADTKRDHPEVTEWPAKLEAMRERLAARKAAQQQPAEVSA